MLSAVMVTWAEPLVRFYWYVTKVSKTIKNHFNCSWF